MISLPYSLGIAVRDSITQYRRKNNIPEPEELKKIYDKQMYFLDDELQYVRDLVVNGDSIDYLDLFSNLTSIKLDGEKELSQVQIQEIINKHPNLTELSIIHQSDLQYLDVSNLTNLQVLNITSNNSLKKITGIDKINDLFSLTFYDNQTYSDSSIRELLDVAYKSAYDLGTDLNIDVLYMPNFMQYLSDKNKSLSDVADNFSWCEHLKYGIENDRLKYKTGELKIAYDKALSVVNKYISPTDTPEQRYAILYQWMCENVKYDEEALGTNHTHTEDGITRGRKGGTNGTVNGLVYGSCVCQGYSKTMQMLLKLSGIYSSDIGCVAEQKERKNPIIKFDGKRALDPSDHSILKVNLNGKIYYSDVTWDASRFQNGKDRKYFLLSKREISSDHKLIGEDRVIDSGISISEDTQKQLLEFASQRIKKVNEKNKGVNYMEQNQPTQQPEIKVDNQTRLNEINQELTQTRQQYGAITQQMELLMKRNSETPIPNYQQQLDMLMKQRDSLTQTISEQMSTQKTYQNIIDYEKEQKHKATISQVERIMGIRITDTAGMAVDPNMYGGVPQALAKDTSTLRDEEGYINKTLEGMYYEGQLDIRTYQEMKAAVRKEYESFIKTAPKSIQQESDVASQTINPQQSNTPQPNTQTPTPERVEIIDPLDELRRKHGYFDMMSEAERMEFDEKIEKAKQQVDIDDKRKRFKEIAGEMADETVFDLDAILRQQQLEEIARQQAEQVEPVERTGRRM